MKCKQRRNIYTPYTNKMWRWKWFNGRSRL